MHRADGKVLASVAATMAESFLVMHVLPVESVRSVRLRHLGAGRVAHRSLLDLGRLTVKANVFLAIITYLAHDQSPWPRRSVARRSQRWPRRYRARPLRHRY